MYKRCIKMLLIQMRRRDNILSYDVIVQSVISFCESGSLSRILLKANDTIMSEHVYT